MPDPGERDEKARQRDLEDHIMREDMRRTGRHSSIAPRHFRGFLPGGRMYGEDDSVVAYFVGHAWRGITALFRLASGARQSGTPSSEDLRESFKYRDRDRK